MGRGCKDVVSGRAVQFGLVQAAAGEGVDAGELFDLEDDPHEVRNLWDDPAAAPLKARLLHRFMQAELQREPTRMPRIWGA